MITKVSLNITSDDPWYQTYRALINSIASSSFSTSMTGRIGPNISLGDGVNQCSSRTTEHSLSHQRVMGLDTSDNCGFNELCL